MFGYVEPQHHDIEFVTLTAAAALFLRMKKRLFPYANIFVYLRPYAKYHGRRNEDESTAAQLERNA
jgi:hypothetical protein